MSQAATPMSRHSGDNDNALNLSGNGTSTRPRFLDSVRQQWRFPNLGTAMCRLAVAREGDELTRLEQFSCLLTHGNMGYSSLLMDRFLYSLNEADLPRDASREH